MRKSEQQGKFVCKIFLPVREYFQSIIQQSACMAPNYASHFNSIGYTFMPACLSRRITMQMKIEGDWIDLTSHSFMSLDKPNSTVVILDRELWFRWSYRTHVLKNICRPKIYIPLKQHDYCMSPRLMMTACMSPRDMSDVKWKTRTFSIVTNRVAISSIITVDLHSFHS
jgi:hypothetical protein